MVKRAFIIAILLSFFLSRAQAQDVTCMMHLEKIIHVLSEAHEKEEKYVLYKNYSIVDEHVSNSTTTTMWVKGNKIYTKNDKMEVFQDEHYQVYLLDDENLIMIHSISADEVTAPAINAGEQMKKLKENALQITCKKGNIVELDLPAKLKTGEPVPYQDVVLTYKNNYELEKGIYTRGDRTDVYEYISYIPKGKFPFSNPLAKIFSSENKLKTEFLGYEIKDFRNK